MKSISVRNTRLFQTLLAIIMIAGLLFPPAAVAYAQDEIPPADTPAEVQDEPQSVELPAEATVEAPAEPTDAVELPLEATVEPLVAEPTEVVLPVEQTVEAPAASPSGEEEGAEEVVTETIAEMVEVLDETNTVLVGEDGEVIPLTSEEASEVLTGADPFFYDSTTHQYIGYTGLCGTCPDFVDVCNQVEKPLTEALADSKLGNGANLYIEGGRYDEDVTITKELNLYGGTAWWLGPITGNVHGFASDVSIRKITLNADLGTVHNVFADTINVTEAEGKNNTYRGNMLDDALNMIDEGGTISLAAATYTSSSDFEIGTDNITLQGTGDATRINGDDNGNGIDIQAWADGVTVRNLRVVSSRTGILVNGDNTTIDNVTVKDLTNGIVLEANSKKTTLTDMVLTGNQVGLLAKFGSSNAAIHNSNIFGNTSYGVKNESNNTLNATGNWWGSAAGPRNCYLDKNNNVQCSSGSGDKVYVNKTYDWTERKCFLFWCSDESYSHPLNVLTGNYLTSAACNDGLATTIDTRNANGSCTYTTISCDDADASTVDELNADGTCSHTPVPCEEWQHLDDAGQCVNNACDFENQSRDNDGVCQYTDTCEDWQTRNENTGACDVNDCELAGQVRDNTDGSCAYTDVCEAGTHRNVDTGECVATECAAGSFDANSDGTCEATTCQPGSFDANSDGQCEVTICGGGYNDLNSDGVCEQTICPQGYIDIDSNGQCEVVEPDAPDGPTGPAGILGGGGAGGVGGGGVIPVTGGLNQLSCTEANTLVLASGIKVGFSAPMCGMEAGLADENEQSLPAPLPEGMNFAAGMTLTLQKGTTEFDVLPDPVTDTLSFVIPADLKDKTFYIMFWDSAANGGLGGWFEIPTKVSVNGTVVSAPLTDENGDTREVVSGMEVTALLTGETTLNFTGTFVLAYK